MKLIIWIIALALIAWGVWWFVNRNNTATGAYNNNAAAVEGASTDTNANVDLGQFDSKG